MYVEFNSALGFIELVGNLGIGLFLQDKTKYGSLAHSQLIAAGEILELLLGRLMRATEPLDQDRHV